MRGRARHHGEFGQSAGEAIDARVISNSADYHGGRLRDSTGVGRWAFDRVVRVRLLAARGGSCLNRRMHPIRFLAAFLVGISLFAAEPKLPGIHEAMEGMIAKNE